MNLIQTLSLALFGVSLFIETVLSRQTWKLKVVKAIYLLIACHVAFLNHALASKYFLLMGISISSSLWLTSKEMTRDQVEVSTKNIMNIIYLNYFGIFLVLCKDLPDALLFLPLLAQESLLFAVFTVMIFLSFGVAPLQQGTIDVVETFEKNSQFIFTVTPKALAFIGLLQTGNDLFHSLHSVSYPSAAGLILITSSLSHLVATSQMSVARTFSYLEVNLLPPLLFLPEILANSDERISILLIMYIFVLFFSFRILYFFLPHPTKNAKLHWNDLAAQKYASISIAMSAVSSISTLILVFLIGDNGVGSGRLGLILFIITSLCFLISIVYRTKSQKLTGN